MKLSSKGQHRLFFALDIPDDIQDAIDLWRSNHDINGRIVPQENFHITLKFLGNVSHHLVDNILENTSIPEIQPFDITLNKMGYFTKSQILFAEVAQGNESIRKLSRFLANGLRLCDGIKQEKRNQLPHVTLAREVVPPVDFTLLSNISFRVRDFCLMESLSLKQGVVYETVERWPLYTPSVREKLLGITR